MLGAKAGYLPVGEPTVTWREAFAPVHIVAHRNGRMTWYEDKGVHVASAAALLGHALDSLTAAGELFPWPDGLAADSMVVRIGFHWQFFPAKGTAVNPVVGVRGAVPIFSLAVPAQQEARVIYQPKLSYPSASQLSGARGYLVMQFVVDTSGRVDMQTVHDQWPTDRPRLTGELGMYYASFLDVVRRALPDFRFAPARIGKCAVRQLESEPFIFNLR